MDGKFEMAVLWSLEADKERKSFQKFSAAEAKLF